MGFEKMYAVVKTGGKQYRVEEGTEVVVERINAAIGDKIDFDVLFFADGDKIAAGSEASGAKVTAEVVEQLKGDKVIVFKFKKRKGYKRTRGHRQELTRVVVTGIQATGGAKKAAKAEPKEEPKAAKPAEAAAPAPEAAAEPDQCAAVKADGERCQNKAKEGSKYCGVHAKKYDS